VTGEEQSGEAGYAAIAVGRWGDARTAFERALASTETAEANFGLGVALWWLGENQQCVDRCLRAYSLFRRSGDLASAVQCAVWLAITYKANFANFPAANGWIARAERLLGPLEPGPLHGWVWIARAYRLDDLEWADSLTSQAADVARAAGDVDLELVALSQLGLIRVAKGETAAGFAMLDEAMAATFGGEPSNLDTVVYICCDMLNACELASDIDRAAQWCKVADDFVRTYGCPFLYAECRIFYGSILTARGRWDDAERELGAGLRITDGACPALHSMALTRLAALRIRQGRLEDARQLLAGVDEGVHAAAEEALSVAALLLARGDSLGAVRSLEGRMHHLAEHRAHLATALELLADALLGAGDLDGADAAARRLANVASSAESDRLRAMASSAEGRTALARGDRQAAAERLGSALATWSSLELPFEVARVRFDLARTLAVDQRDVAVDHARRALAGFERLGATVDADRVSAFLRSLGVTPRTGARGVGLLTAREQDVLRLLGAGLSNPEIADRLFMSRKTASHHVSSILAKLNLRNRAEAAAYAVREFGQRDGRTDPR
jgi:DNA-binding CsgD family transcriptional regulator